MRYYSLYNNRFAGLFSLLVANLYNKPLVLSEHADYVSERSKQEDHRIATSLTTSSVNDYRKTKQFAVATYRLNFHRNIRKLLYKRATSITSLYREFQKHQIRLSAPPSSCTIIRNGVPIIPLKTTPKVAMNKIGYFGRISPEKNVLSLIHAFNHFTKFAPGVTCNIVGPFSNHSYVKSCMDCIEELSLGHVIHFTNEADPDHFYNDIDVLVLPSHNEGQPYVLLESMARNIPVLTADVGNCADMVKWHHNKNINPLVSLSLVQPRKIY